MMGQLLFIVLYFYNYSTLTIYTYVLNQEEYRIMPAYDNEYRPGNESNRYLRLSALNDVCLMKTNL